MLTGSALVSGYSLKQNVSLLWHWARMQEANLDDLAEICFVDHGKLVTNIGKLRSSIAAYQEEENLNRQLGGVGVDVEVDEVCLRARWVLINGVWHREWIHPCRQGLAARSPPIPLEPDMLAD